MIKVKNYLSLIKFSHTIFAMPFAMIGFFLGTYGYRNLAGKGVGQWNLDKPIPYPEPPGYLEVYVFFTRGLPKSFFDFSSTYQWLIYHNNLIKFFLILICMITARSAAMAFNRYLDRSFDARNPRTATREIPKGIISPRNALFFVILNCVVFVLITFLINRICFYLSPVALFVILFYSYTKRFTPLCHLVLGLGLSLAPIGAYLAIMGKFHWLPVFFSFAVVFWVSGFDIIYSLQDEDFDKSQKLFSMPAWLGKAKALRVSELLHLLSAACVVLAGKLGHFGPLYWVGVLVFGGMLIYQHSIVKPGDLRRVNLAFMTANGIASVIFAAFVISDIFIF